MALPTPPLVAGFDLRLGLSIGTRRPWQSWCYVSAGAVGTIQFSQGKRLDSLLFVLLAMVAVPFSELATAATRATKEEAMPASNRDWKLIEKDSKEKYNLYLCSREWAVLKEAVRERSGGICERCNRNPMQACHHLTYENKYGEKLEDLQAICQACHEYTHGKSNFDPAAAGDSTGFESYARRAVEAGYWPVPWELVTGWRSETPYLVQLVYDESVRITREQSGASYLIESDGDSVPKALLHDWNETKRQIALIQNKCLRCDVLLWVAEGRPWVDYDDYASIVYGKMEIPLPRDVDGFWCLWPERKA